jgi:2-polyprenyl-3-methyl-5-hydroxy-6-metoxy-1,4-benzoquinol methylase
VRQQNRQHWEKIWSAADPREVTWYQDSPKVSLGLIEATGIGHEARILDVGCGASTLVDGLFDRGFENISMLDLSGSALSHAKARIGDRAEHVTWMIGNVTTFRQEEPIDLWHDRAVLHFLVEESDRKRYAQALSDSLAPNGHVIIATFALDGPKKCSGLEVLRYGPREITGLLGESFQLLELVHETHLSPGKIEQRFTYFRLQRQQK